MSDQSITGEVRADEPAFPADVSEDVVDQSTDDVGPLGRWSASWGRIATLVVLPLAVVIAAGALGYVVWERLALSSVDGSRSGAAQAARDTAVAILSYQPDSAEKDLTAAQSRLTGDFRDSYATLTKDVVIPSAQEKRISAEANVPAVATVSATADSAVVLVFVNQIVVVGDTAPTSSTSSVRVALERIDGDWLVSAFDPV